MKPKSNYHICLKYSGLDIPYILETDLFFIIPSDYKKKLDKFLQIYKENITIPDLACKWNIDSEIYVLLKNEIKFHHNVNNVSEIIPKCYDFFISLIGLLFTNHLKLETVNILKVNDDKYSVIRIYDYIIKREIKNTNAFIFGDRTHPGKLESFLNELFNNIRNIKNKNYFYYNFFFSWYLYKEAKNTTEIIRKISDYWISLEILSTVYFKHINEYNMKLFSRSQLRSLKKIITNFVSKIPRKKLICVEEFKDDFINHVRSKLSNYASIRKKVKLFAEKVLLPEHKNLEISGSNLQDIYNIIDNFYKYRNNFFHNGILPDPNDKKFHEDLNCFCLLLERIIFSIIKSDKVKFIKRNKCFQALIINYPFEEIDIKSTFEETNEFYKEIYEKHSYLFPFVDEMNENHEKIKNVYHKVHKMVFSNDEYKITQNINLNIAHDYNQSFESDQFNDLSLNKILNSRSSNVIKSEISPNFLLQIPGFLTGISGTGSQKLRKLKFSIFPPYFEFLFK